MLMLRATASSPRMFQSRFFDALSRTHYAVVPLLYVPASVGLTVYSVTRTGVSIPGTLVLVAAGALAWTLVEYLLHRFVFHLDPHTRLGKRLHFLVHGVHHQWPRDRYRLVMPPAVSACLFVACLWAFTATLGRFGYAFHAGFTLGYLCYDLTHYYLHHGTPRAAGSLQRHFRELRRHHMLHHFKASDCCFGVSCTLWDHVFSTHARSNSWRSAMRT
jgi:sterol desaturase/sphingolipid hydroxylase (fatty acid hydroxylase superfamily)